MYLLDTDICVFILRGNQALQAKLEALPPDVAVYTSIVNTKASDLVLVTHNVKHFERIPGLKMEDWVTG